jgi:hypothetical protein
MHTYCNHGNLRLTGASESPPRMSRVRHPLGGMDMKSSLFTEEQMIGIFAGAGGRDEDGRRMPQESNSARSAMRGRLWRLGRNDYNTVGPHAQRRWQSAASRLCETQRSRNATGRGAALHRGLRAPSRCFAEPIRLKSTWDSAHRWMKEGAQVKTCFDRGVG